MNWIKDVAFLVKVFERPGPATKCINSIRRLWPGARIYVADDSRVPLDLPMAYSYTRLPYDVGCSAGRNALIQASSEPYVVQVDDDYVFTEAVDIGRMVQLLEDHDELVLAGCKCRHIRSKVRAGWTKYFADVRLEGAKLIADRPTRWHDEPDGLRWAQVDVVSNFWVAKRRLFEYVMWDERLIIGGEHADFFQRLQAANGDKTMMRRMWARLMQPGLSPQLTLANPGMMQVAFIPSMHIDHIKKRPPGYQAKRKRDRTYEAMYREMWGITRVDRWRKRR